ncbi:hypothetical protein LEP1GSC170_4016 [Leptospira interrogans serovar Bataviae str. HAI135]|nr:hypothetical protein LEP1GSC170_4016 [Leptospira interrogans serovar Bataviae str. HAI135]
MKIDFSETLLDSNLNFLNFYIFFIFKNFYKIPKESMKS